MISSLLQQLLFLPDLSKEGYLSPIHKLVFCTNSNNSSFWACLYTPTFDTYEECLQWRNQMIAEYEQSKEPMQFDTDKPFSIYSVTMFNAINCLVLHTKHYNRPYKNKSMSYCHNCKHNCVGTYSSFLPKLDFEIKS